MFLCIMLDCCWNNNVSYLSRSFLFYLTYLSSLSWLLCLSYLSCLSCLSLVSCLSCLFCPSCQIILSILSIYYMCDWSDMCFFVSLIHLPPAIYLIYLLLPYIFRIYLAISSSFYWSCNHISQQRTTSEQNCVVWFPLFVGGAAPSSQSRLSHKTKSALDAYTYLNACRTAACVRAQRVLICFNHPRVLEQLFATQ